MVIQMKATGYYINGVKVNSQRRGDRHNLALMLKQYLGLTK